ncbi:hypothetical protein NYO98_10515 [Nocardioides sp. STR2]|uniref:Uncharacterized protein n=1 Tax=Nocardioides pini TaxID=2975053 RepID=A0ABT4CCM4_9ACTN|nr:hypothetical protein [Nocardioides pini]MCY4726711.1 hypothetical protein [Nocardioides pini]
MTTRRPARIARHIAVSFAVNVAIAVPVAAALVGPAAMDHLDEVAASGPGEQGKPSNKVTWHRYADAFPGCTKRPVSLDPDRLAVVTVDGHTHRWTPEHLASYGGQTWVVGYC